MGNVSSIVRELKTERDRVQKQRSGLNAALVAFACCKNARFSLIF
jgi:hypothetical protein